jgi:hypothetical protein
MGEDAELNVGPLLLRHANKRISGGGHRPHLQAAGRRSARPAWEWAITGGVIAPDPPRRTGPVHLHDAKAKLAET